jgi:CDP-6-deoxy-D-xylo-4-hexulose-3-dehydrase
MHREMDDVQLKDIFANLNPDLNKDFIFIAPAYNMRSTEINAVLALNQLKRLDENNIKRKRNLDIFLDNLDKNKYYVDFDREGNSNYAFTLLLAKEDMIKRNKVEKVLKDNGIEFRRGMSGGGNQLRQPYLKELFQLEYAKYPVCDYVHHYGWYIGNYPELETSKIHSLCQILNEI